MILEVCVDHACSAKAAIQGGADRLEVCGSLSVGGTTPSAGFLEQCVEMCSGRGIASGSVETAVMIRPHAGGFHYGEDDLATMVRNIRIAKSMGASSVVFGVLTASRQVDCESAKRLLEIARPMQATFHRAFDVVTDPRHALDELIQLGFDRLLTSGQAAEAGQGAELIAELLKQSDGAIAIIAGSGIDCNNVREIVQQTGVHEIHASASEKVPANYPIDFGGHLMQTSEASVRELRQVIDESVG